MDNDEYKKWKKLNIAFYSISLIITVLRTDSCE